MDKKLESRITRLEKLLKINGAHDINELRQKWWQAAALVSQVVIALDYDDSPKIKEWKSIEDTLKYMIWKLNRLSFKL